VEFVNHSCHVDAVVAVSLHFVVVMQAYVLLYVSCQKIFLEMFPV
jgi:hypothetical protein